MEELIPFAVLALLLIIAVLAAILLIVYISKTNTLTRDADSLYQEIAALKRQLASLDQRLTDHEPAPEGPNPVLQPSNPPPSAPEIYVSPFQPQVATESTEPQSRPSRPRAASRSNPTAAGSRAATLGSVSSSKTGDNATRSGAPRSRTRAEWESLIGGRLLNWIGAVATIIGIGFFLRYAFQNDWITPSLRVGIGGIAGVALLAGGDMSFRKGYRIFSQGLIGAGISVLYLAAYASFSFYHLEGRAIAFLMMSAVTVLTFVQAFRFNSLAVSLLGWIGGFLTPVLLSTGEANEVALFTYVALLDAGLLAIVATKPEWEVLQPLSLVATYLLYVGWYAGQYQASDFYVTAVFLTLFWGLFHSLDVWQVVRSARGNLLLQEASAVLSAVFYYSALYIIVDPEHHDYLATVTLALGGAYLLTLAAIRGVNPPRVTEARFALIGAVLLVIATALRFTGFDTVFCWAIEALALVLAATYWKEPGVLGGGALLYLAAIVKLLVTPGWYSYGRPETFVLLANKRALAFLGLIAAGAFGAEAIRRSDVAKNKTVSTLLDYCWSLALIVLAAVEIQDEFGRLISTRNDREWLHFAGYLAIGCAWMVCALALVRYGAARARPSPLKIGLLAAAASAAIVAIAGFSYQPINEFTPMINVRAGAFLVVLIGLLILLEWTREENGVKWPRWIHPTTLVLCCLMIFVLCTAETRDYFGRILDSMNRAYPPEARNTELDEAFRKYSNLQQVALSLVWLFYSIVLIGYGIWRRILLLRVIAIIIFGIAILKIFIYDLSFLETLYRIFSFIGLGLILLSVSFLYQRFKSAIFESAPAAKAES